jgi:hypothetical protein
MGTTVLLMISFALAAFVKTLDMQDPALLPARDALAPGSSAAAYAGWPGESSSTGAKLAYLIGHLPKLSLHCLVYHWTLPDAVGVVCATLTMLVAWRMRLSTQRSAQLACCLWASMAIVYPLSLAACQGLADADGMEQPRTSWRQCPTALQAQAMVQVSHLFPKLLAPSEWRVSLVLSPC